MQALSSTDTSLPTSQSQSDLDLPAIAVRVRHVMEATGFDGKEFAAKAGVPYSTMRAYLGGRPPSAEFLAGAYRAFGCSPIYILTGHGDPFVNKAPAEKPNGFVTIPYLPMPSRMTPGAVSEPEPTYQVPGMSVSQEWLAKRGLDTKTLAVVRVRGRAMEKVLWEGDTVLVDTSDKAAETGYVYVLRQGNELLARYCQLLPGGKLRVSSENPSFTPYDVDLGQADDVQIVGRVVAATHEF